MEETDFLHLDTDSQKLNLIKNFLDEYGQKWVWPVWSQDCKIDCISKKTWNNLIFLHDVTNPRKLKVALLFFGLVWWKMVMAFYFMRPLNLFQKRPCILRIDY